MKISPQAIKIFQREIYSYYHAHCRANLPWRKTKNSYRILISEIMLQQTQVARVIPKYKEFIAHFPNFKTLARAPLRDVLFVWSGLGYNRRALALKKIANIVESRWGGRLPRDGELLETLPGIGRASASAIAAFAWNEPAVFVETNIRSVFIHFFFTNQKNVNDKDVLLFVEQTLDKENSREWYYALMDYGAMLKEKYGNPNAKSAHYNKQIPFEGSHRQIRGKILKAFTERKIHTESEIVQRVGVEASRVKRALNELQQEGFIQIRRNKLTLAR